MQSSAIHYTQGSIEGGQTYMVQPHNGVSVLKMEAILIHLYKTHTGFH